MKKMMILVGLLSAFTIKAETYQRSPVVGMLPVENMYASFEVLTPKYDKVILDCQSFINGMTFYNNMKVVHDVRMVNYDDCNNVYDFISQSRAANKPICLEIEVQSNVINLSNDEASACQ